MNHKLYFEETCLVCGGSGITLASAKCVWCNGTGRVDKTTVPALDKLPTEPSAGEEEDTFSLEEGPNPANVD